MKTYNHMNKRIKFASQAKPKLLEAMKELAKSEGRQLQAVLEDAMALYLESREGQKIRASVLEHFHGSVSENRRLAELLAK